MTRPIIIIIIIIIITIIIIWSPLCKAGREWEHSISPNTPTPHNQPMEGRTRRRRKRKNSRKMLFLLQRKSRSCQQESTIALLLKPASPTPSNTGSLRSFQRDTERGTKLLRYWEVLQRGGANECLWATKAPRVTRAGTYGNSNAPLKGSIWLLLILNSMHNSATDRRWVRLQSKTPPARKSALLTTQSSSLRYESAAEHQTGRKPAGKSSKKISEGATNHEIPAKTFS